MKKAFVSIVGILACLMAVSCSVIRPSETIYVDARYIVETEEPNALVEVRLDGDLVFSGKTRKEKEGNVTLCKLTATYGGHYVEVSSSGYVAWEREITLVGGGHEFWAVLKKK